MRTYYRPTYLDIRIQRIQDRGVYLANFGSALIEGWKDESRDRQWLPSEVI